MPATNKQVCSVADCERPRKGREWCGMHTERWRKYGDPAVVLRKTLPPRLCTAAGCERKRFPSTGYCHMHTRRAAKHGSPDIGAKAGTGRQRHSQGYVVVRRKGHPVAQSRQTPWVYEHRVLLYDAIGPGWHDCHHCGTPVSWDLPFPQDMDALVVDHLDDDKTNNDLSNLVPSCHFCNVRRAREGRAIHIDDETVAAIRAAYLIGGPGRTHRGLAAQFGIGRDQVANILNHQGRWAESA